MRGIWRRRAAVAAALAVAGSLLALTPATPALASDGGQLGVVTGTGTGTPHGGSTPVGCGVPSCRVTGSGGRPGTSTTPRPSSSPSSGGYETDTRQRIYGSQFWAEGRPPAVLYGVPNDAQAGRWSTSTCPPVTRNGNRQGSIGVTYSYGVTYRTMTTTASTFDLPPRIDPSSLVVDCRYPPAYEDHIATCALHLDGQITGPFDNPDQAEKTLLTRSVDTAFARSRTLANCLGSWKLALSTPINVYGRYKGSATTLAVACVVRHFTTPDGRTGKTPPDTLLLPTPCGSPYVADAQEARGQLDCTGWKQPYDLGVSPAGQPWTFRASDCPGGKPKAKIRCQVGGAPTIVLPGGANQRASRVRSAQVDVLDDAAANEVTWPQPRISGATRVYGSSTVLIRQDGGTPWKNGASHNDQPIEADFNNPHTGLQPGPWIEQFFSAGQPGRPTITHLRYSLDAAWPSEVVQVTGLQLDTGAFNVTRRAGTVRAVGTCDSDPLSVDVLRARLSSSQ